MPGRIVINTSPTLALIAATGGLDLLTSLYDEVLVPREVIEEILAGGENGRGVIEIKAATGITRWPEPARPALFLQNILDRGEAAVIQLALDQGIPLVCIDEAAGRRQARLSGLTVTGSLGILLKAKKRGLLPQINPCIQNMIHNGIWLTPQLVDEALRLAGEK